MPSPLELKISTAVATQIGNLVIEQIRLSAHNQELQERLADAEKRAAEKHPKK